VEQEVVLSEGLERPVKELEDLVVRKTPVVLEEFLTDRAAPVPKVIGELVVREDQVHCTAAAPVAVVTTAVAVAALTKIGAAPTPVEAEVDLHTPIQHW
jgi:hypothetical protein